MSRSFERPPSGGTPTRERPRAVRLGNRRSAVRDRRADPFDGSSTGSDTALMATGNVELVRSSFDAFLRGDWDCHDRRKVLATLFERQREGVVTGLSAVVAVDERIFVEVTGARLEQW